MPAAVPKCSPDEFLRLTQGLRLSYLTKILNVSPQMVRVYREKGAPEYRIAPLRQLFSQLGEGTSNATP